MRRIVAELGMSHSTVSRELKRNMGLSENEVFSLL